MKSNIEAAQAKQKKYYDEKFGASLCFRVGSTVFKKDFTRKKRKGGKLDYHYRVHTSSLQLLESHARCQDFDTCILPEQCY